MKTFSTFLSEGRDAPLYHGTSLPKATWILHSNILEARATPQTINSFETFAKHKIISTSRSYRFAQEWASARGVVFELNQSIIAQTNRIGPHNFFNDSARNYGGTVSAGFNQHEEAIIGDLNPLSRYLLKVIISSESVLQYWTNHRIKGGGGIHPQALKDHPLLYAWDTKKWLNR